MESAIKTAVNKSTVENNVIKSEVKKYLYIKSFKPLFIKSTI